jgi:hypothetical protein
VEAAQKENESWRTFDASADVRYEDMERGASIIPLGELYTIKRNGQHKFRQYAMGNLLKAGKDYGDTFSSTVSGDGLRWFCSLAAACNKKIRGWDATTGYLQTKQRIKIYAYSPSHHGYSDMEFEELALFRRQLLKIKKEQGPKGIKDFSRNMKKERRWKPEVVLELKSSTYGIPDAGQAFAMFMQGLHIKKCGLTQCEVDPAIYYKIEEEASGKDKEKIVVLLCCSALSCLVLFCLALPCLVLPSFAGPALPCLVMSCHVFYYLVFPLCLYLPTAPHTP